ncbi:hypothetical protein [Paludibacterium denitrificans]|uniref:hypothetical protein n=1 Tax=Paludibacterium denitrificans TaxID=2675226 RepID=UPI001E37FAA0|nr:hypothetical protein [Paludibacterium denitrificans]
MKEMYAPEILATTPYQEEGIVAPRLQQSQTNITYHLDAIRRSDILTGWIAYKSGYSPDCRPEIPVHQR